MMFYRGANVLGECGYAIGYMHSGWGLLMMGGFLLVAALIVVAIVMGVKKSGHRHAQMHDMELLNERFVKGEISEEEYLKIKTVLKNK